MLVSKYKISSKCATLKTSTNYSYLKNGQQYTFQGVRYYAKRKTETQLEIVGEDLIPTINKLQEIFTLTNSKLDLPQIVVVGGQSSGKSSVLENLVGRDFLPRGSGIVTRRPLILQLRPIKEGEAEYGVFFHKPDTKLYDFQEVKREIERDTERVAGANKGISNEPILLKIYSPRVLPLTLVDTPGICRVATGDQPVDIEMQIKSLIREYINQPNCIILAVQAANQDLATSDALNLAREADPEGSRTVGVLTKIDLMDKGTDCMSVLAGRSFPLRRGWTGVVNRSQAEIDQQKAIQLAQKKEGDFFRTHPAYSSIAEKCGSAVLGEKCNKMLSEHIKKSLPALRYQINSMIRKKTEELDGYGQPLGDESQLGWHLMQLLSKYTDEISKAITGRGGPTDNPTTEGLNGGARVRYLFQEIFKANLDAVSSTQGLSTREIKTAIKNAAGSKPALFVPDDAFEYLAKRQIKYLREPTLNIAEAVYHELSRIVTEFDNKDVNRFWRLREKMVDVTGEILRNQLLEANKMINEAINLELSYINTNHPDFIGMGLLLQRGEPAEAIKATSFDDYHAAPKKEQKGGGGILSYIFGSGSNAAPDQTKVATTTPTPNDLPSPYAPTKTITDHFENELTEREKAQIAIIRKLLDSYIGICKKQLQDHVTKIIMHVIVRGTLGVLKQQLQHKLYKGDQHDYTDLLSEANDVELKRHVCKAELDALHAAANVLLVE